MIQKIKNFFYFPVASYFRFFAAIRLRKWNPRIVVVTGSSGKTTLLHLIESQLGSVAKYSHEANSSFGIPFDILDIHRKDLTLIEWPIIFILPWVNVFKPLPKEKIYVVEADCDRPHEGKFLSDLLNPEVTLWLNVSKTHSMNFEELVKNKTFDSLEEAIAYEFGFFAERTKKFVIANADSPFVVNELKRVKTSVKKISAEKSLERYQVKSGGTEFILDGKKFIFKYLLPKELATSILMCKELVDYLRVGFDESFSDFKLPPGRSSVFKGIKNITIIDSTYNANLDSMKAVINMFGQIEAGPKWVVLGDMIEQGREEEAEHLKLTDVISKYNFDHIILMGSRISKYTYPSLKKIVDKNVVLKHFLGPKEVLDYLKENINGGEVILFKGARFLEGVIENLLENRNDASKLARREKIWEIRRKKWGL